MEKIILCGGKSLQGVVQIPGAKNSVLPIMAASVLCRDKVMLTRVPRLSDVVASMEILHEIGCAAHMVDHSLTILPAEKFASSISPYLMQTMRSSIFFLAPLVVRTGSACISTPGGCNLGARPIDIHLAGMVALGAKIEISGESVCVYAKNGLHGADFSLRFPSVGATETLLMAASCAKGRTVLRNVAIEPEIVDLVHFLRSAGAEITGEGTRILHIEGQEQLRGTQHAICSDRITAATVMCAVAGCGGEALLKGSGAAQNQALITALRAAGCAFSTSGESSIVIASSGKLRGIGTFHTGVYPALPTDVAPLLAAALLKAKGASCIHDAIFENRFVCASGFAALGANVCVDGAAAALVGVKRLRGASVTAQDLRGGAALAIAALMAEGESALDGVSFIARGYENIVELLTSLGANCRAN